MRAVINVAVVPMLIFDPMMIRKLVSEGRFMEESSQEKRVKLTFSRR